MNKPLTALYSTPDRMYIGPELAFQMITPRQPKVMNGGGTETLYERKIEESPTKIKRNLKIGIPAAGLAALIALGALTETGKSISGQVAKPIGNIFDNAIYGADVTSKRYKIVD